MKKVKLHKIASVTYNCNLPQDVEITDHCPAKAGNVIVVKALGEKMVYNELELTTGRMAKIAKGDIIAGALGSRKALKGFVGVVPEIINVGDTLNILNLGGVIGQCTSRNIDVGEPLKVEVLGMVTDGKKVVNITDNSLPIIKEDISDIPLILISGTCMHSGKTSVACGLVQKLTSSGYKVSGVKISGVACLKDVLKMADYGSVSNLSFLDCGLPSTVGVDDLGPMARALIKKLSEDKPDVIVIEMGDGIIGGYGVASIFNDKEFMENVKAHIVCANDLVGAWGAQKFLTDLKIPVTMYSGPVTDNEVGVSYIQNNIGVPAVNSRNDIAKLADSIKGKVFA